jgi:hypothetical protein
VRGRSLSLAGHAGRLSLTGPASLTHHAEVAIPGSARSS